MGAGLLGGFNLPFLFRINYMEYYRKTEILKGGTTMRKVYALKVDCYCVDGDCGCYSVYKLYRTRHDAEAAGKKLDCKSYYVEEMEVVKG